jgi:nuclease S1
MKSRQLPALLFVLISLAPAPAFAWSRLGHWLVGDLAAQRLSLRAQEQVKMLLAGEEDPTLGGVASWADDLRNTDPDRFKATSRWHYINAQGGGCGFEVVRDCKDGGCVVQAIEEQLKILRDRSQPQSARRDALKFIVHFVGDLHQPMHAGNRVDQGGNQYQISLRTDIEPEAYARNNYVDGVMGTNLHSIWDFYILAEARRSPRSYAAFLRKRVRSIKPGSAGTPLSWAEESCRMIDPKGIYPNTHVMDSSYLDAKRPLAEDRILLAAARLAALLNGVLK